MRKSIKRAGFVGVSVLAASSVGIAFAAWTAGGSGNGSAAATSAQNLTVTAANATGQLFPGGTGDLKVTVSNPNGYAVTLSSVTQTANQPITVDAGHANCNVSSVTFTSATGLTQVIGAAAQNVAVAGLVGKVNMSGAANDDCQGATFTVPVTLAGASS